MIFCHPVDVEICQCHDSLRYQTIFRRIACIIKYRRRTKRSFFDINNTSYRQPTKGERKHRYTQSDLTVLASVVIFKTLKMSTPRIVGKFQSLGRTEERTLKSEFTFNWDLYECSLTPLPRVLESPPFRIMNQFGYELEWKLQVKMEFHTLRCHSTVLQPHNDIHLSVENCGEAGRGNSVFAVRFKVFRTDAADSLERVYHDDTTAPRNNVIVSQDSSTKRSSKFSLFNIYIGVTGKLHILLELIETESHSNVNQDVSSLAQHDHCLKNEYEQLFESGKFSDVTIVVDKQELHLHKNILSDRSPVFAAMFDHDLRENNSNVVLIEDQSYEVMKEFFRYVYAAKVHALENHMIGLLITSNKYAVEGLKSLCEQELIKDLKNETVLEHLNLASCLNAKILETECVKFIVANAKDVVGLPTFDIHSVSTNELRNEIVRGIARRF